MCRKFAEDSHVLEQQEFRSASTGNAQGQFYLALLRDWSFLIEKTADGASLANDYHECEIFFDVDGRALLCHVCEMANL